MCLHDLHTFNWFLIASTGCVVAPGAAMKRLASNAFVLQPCAKKKKVNAKATTKNSEAQRPTLFTTN